MPWDQWWFWLIAFIFGIPIIAVIGEALAGVIKALRGGSSKELKKLRREVERLEEQLKEAVTAQKLLELQKRLSQRELQEIERQALPEGVAVFMFTDIEDFTAYLERHGDERAFRRLQRHHWIVRGCVERHGGLIIKEIGDGFLVSFTSARRALLCAYEIQRLLERSGFGEELKARIGLHAGEPIKDGRDVIGHAVNVAERIMGQALGGQVVLSQLVKELAGSLEGFQFLDLGEHCLKGVAQPQRLYELQPIHALAYPLDSEIDRRLEELEKRVREGEDEY
jgi:class 3 adenylate cyclase